MEELKIEKKDKKEQEVKQDRYELVELKQVVGYGIKDNLNGDVITDQYAILMLLNKINKEVSHI